eukprot:CAMPEP_0178955538 /NCGR_PEP_ID=MMETSP0789-20121207/9664_1 /TAXON_ID=3005 /ORGANISM="Rhizosolenia setigera, Strain CCMP 1694" /LENGTH=713 /DNA_ID=CAMNT_0020637187 /DNA_START=160 /DNA_END=2301 /DNA_ORIENTATION=-
MARTRKRESAVCSSGSSTQKRSTTTKQSRKNSSKNPAKTTKKRKKNDDQARKTGEDGSNKKPGDLVLSEEHMNLIDAGLDPIYINCREGNFRIVENLYKEDKECVRKQQEIQLLTPLHYACARQGQEFLVQEGNESRPGKISEGKARIIEFLCKVCPETSTARDLENNLPLDFLLEKKPQLSTVKTLLETSLLQEGVEAKDILGRKMEPHLTLPLLIALDYEAASEIILYLLEKYPESGKVVEGKSRYSPLMRFFYSRNNWFITPGTTSNSENLSRKVLIELLRIFPGAVDYKNIDGETPLDFLLSHLTTDELQDLGKREQKMLRKVVKQYTLLTLKAFYILGDQTTESFKEFLDRDENAEMIGNTFGSKFINSVKKVVDGTLTWSQAGLQKDYDYDFECDATNHNQTQDLTATTTKTVSESSNDDDKKGVRMNNNDAPKESGDCRKVASSSKEKTEKFKDNDSNLKAARSAHQNKTKSMVAHDGESTTSERTRDTSSIPRKRKNCKDNDNESKKADKSVQDATPVSVAKRAHSGDVSGKDNKAGNKHSDTIELQEQSSLFIDKVFVEQAFATVKRYWQFTSHGAHQYCVTFFIRPATQTPITLFLDDLVDIDFVYKSEYTQIKSLEKYKKQRDAYKAETIEVCALLSVSKTLECVLVLSGKRNVRIFFKDPQDKSKFKKSLIKDAVKKARDYRMVYCNAVITEARQILVQTT